MEATREFGLYAARPRSARRWLAPTFASFLIYAALAAAVVSLARLRLSLPEPATEVSLVDKMTFVEKVAKSDPPPPAPAARPAAAAPVVRPEQKVRQLEKPPPPKELVAPQRIPTEPPKEAEPAEDRGFAVFGAPGAGDPAGLEGGVTKGGVAGGQVGGVTELPDGAVPPRMLASNAVPPYPPEARSSRKTGVVVLRVTVLADGTVRDIRVVEGEQPFVDAVLQVVKSWKYEPARFQGQPIAVYRTIRIPFELTR